MNTTLIIAVVAVLVVAVVVTVLNKANAVVKGELEKKENEIRELTGKLAERDADLIRKESEVRTAEALRESERKQHELALLEVKSSHEKSLAELKAGQEKAIEAAKTALALENEKILKAREETLKKEAAETMKNITGGLDQTIKGMTEAFEAQRKTHTEESSAIKTQFNETVKHLKEQTEAIGNQAEDLAKALKGQNKLQGNFGETILENILKEQGFREGTDYESEIWLRDKNGGLIRNDETGKRMRPDFVLHLPDETDILLDSKMSLQALTDYHKAETDEAREEAAVRNLESVKNHVKELISKEYQKYVVGRKTLDFVIMFIPNYGAWQLARMKEPAIFNWALEHNVLITTEETLVPFLRLIHGAWLQKAQMDNIEEIVKAAQDMVERVGIFCRCNAELEGKLKGVLKGFEENTKRLVDGNQSIVKAAERAVSHGIAAPTGKNALPQVNLIPLPESSIPEE